jgi:hypothetical protein
MLTTCITVWLTISGLAAEGSAPTPSATVQAVGIGYPPPRMRGAQARLMAGRAAEVVALRNLAAKLRLGPRAHLPAFRYVGTKHFTNGSVEVTVETIVTVGPVARPGSTATSGARPRRAAGDRP